MQQCFITAYVLIFVGYELDCFDGKVARWRNECSDLGKELDSFSDLVRISSFHPFNVMVSLGWGWEFVVPMELLLRPSCLISI